MPNPTISDLHVNAALTDLSVAYAQEMRGVHDRVFPVVPVQKRSDTYYVYDKQSFLRSDARKRAPGAEAAVSGWKISTDTYTCDRYALAHDIADPDRANADPAVQNLDADGTRFVTQHVMLAREAEWHDRYFTTGVWTGASNGSDMTGAAAPASTANNFLFWDDAASTPIEDIRGEALSVLENTGVMPNKLVVGVRVWQALADHPDILDRIKYTERGIVSEDLVAAVLGLDEVIVSSMPQDSAQEGAAANMGFIAGRHALLAHAAASPGLRTPTAGYTFVWTALPGAPAGGQGVRIKRYRLERNESDRVEGENWADFKVVAPTLGAFLASAVSG